MRERSTLTKERYYSLDIVKVVATLLIVFHHFQQVSGVRFSIINFWQGEFYFGRLVELFFIISGFLMIPYIDKIREGMSFRSYFVRRYLRLLPVVALSTVCCFVVGLMTDPPSDVGQVFGRILETLAVSTGIYGSYSTSVTVNNPMWYVSVLLFCYVLFYGVFFVIRKVKSSYKFFSLVLPFAIMLIGIMIIMGDYDLPFFNRNIARGLISFFAGVILGDLIYKIKIPDLSLFVTIPLLISAVLLMLAYPLLSYQNSFLLYPVLFCYPLLIMSIRTPIVSRLSHQPVWKIIAEISFHAYCWHSLFSLIIERIMNNGGINDYVMTHGLLVMIIYAVIVYLFSTGSYFLIERSPFANK